MRKTILFLISAIMLCFASCSQDEKDIDDVGSGELRMAGLNTIIPLYRYYCWDNTKKGDHMFITEAPSSLVLRTQKIVNGYTYFYEGQNFSIFKNQDFIADVPFYAFYDSSLMNHYFRTTPTDGSLKGQLMGYISSKPQEGLEPLLEYYLDRDKDTHYFLVNQNETRADIEKIGYVFKKIIGYVPPGTYAHKQMVYVTLPGFSGATRYYYETTRIGEYVWMTSNIDIPWDPKNVATIDVTQDQINKSLWAVNVDYTKYPVTPAQFHRYCGRYYSKDGRNQIHLFAKVYDEDNTTTPIAGWGMPSSAAVRQLYAMCGAAQEHEVRQALCFKENEVPIAKKIPNVFCMSGANTNKYGFNLIYGGFRAHSDGAGKYDPTGNRPLFLKTYDLAAFANAHYLPTYKQRTALIFDYPSTEYEDESFLLMPMRWCRRLTDAELGYKLYVNTAVTDIKKLALTAACPAGYTELQNGYLRGFYVQYIINSQPLNGKIPTVTDLKNLALKVPEVIHEKATILN